ncbi:hypothetical protein BB560_002569 [Smittium megazygosporum]|uniref:UNC-45/Cro1/She4 central domain-containing protein n=1 Tax=Smittium megazygosporum TaxID=133381 RepID=A0A2T9ZEF1_9FUNG|nr:hypothetical protein BB560_002569 [Smittium megazygosporum]
MSTESFLEKKYDEISKKLREKPQGLAELLIKRGFIASRMGEPRKANDDISQAAKLMELNPDQKTEQNILALTKFFSGISLSDSEFKEFIDYRNIPTSESHSIITDKSSTGDSKTIKVATEKLTLSELVQQLDSLLSEQEINKMISESNILDNSKQDSQEPNFAEKIALQIKNKTLQSQKLALSDFETLLNIFIRFINLEQIASKSMASEKSAVHPDSPIFSTERAKLFENTPFSNILFLLVNILDFDLKSNHKKSHLFLMMFSHIWNSIPKSPDFDPFLSLFNTPNVSKLYYKISRTFADAIFNTLLDKPKDPQLASALFSSCSIFFQELFFYCIEFLDPKKKTIIIQKSIKILSLHEFEYKDIFVDSNYLISPNMFIDNSLHQKDLPPVPKFLFELFQISSSENDDQPNIFGNVLLSLVLQKFEPLKDNKKDVSTGMDKSYESLILYSTKIVSYWLQSTEQKTKSRGYKILANIFFCQNSDLGSKILSGPLNVESLFEDYEFNYMKTNLNLLLLTDALASKSQYRDLIGEFGSNFLVYSLGIKKNPNLIKDYDESVATHITIIATKILCKLAVSEVPQPSQTQPGSEEEKKQSDIVLEQDLVDIYVSVLKNSSDVDVKTVMNIAEGLGYLSLKTNLKNQISTSPVLLPSLVKHLNSIDHENEGFKHELSTIRFSIVSIVSNLVYRKPLLSDEEKAAHSLRDAAMKKKKNSKEKKLEDELESPKFVNLRCLSLSKIDGLLDVIVSILLHKNKPSETVKETAVKIFLSFAYLPELRGLLVQKGCVNVAVDNSTIFTSKETELPLREISNPTDFTVAYFLSKISVSLPPTIAFPSNGKVKVNSLVFPLLRLCMYSGNDVLCVFEALMALTNFASLPPNPNSSNELTPADLIVDKYKGLDVIEMLVLSDLTMIRRAAVELLCNLVAVNESAFLRFIRSADKVPTIQDINNEEEINKLVKDNNALFRSHKLHLFAALSDIDPDTNLDLKAEINNNSEFDPRTVLASLGTLTTLCCEPKAATFLICSHPRFLKTLENLLACKHIDFIHRAIFIIYSCLNVKVELVSKNIKKYGNLTKEIQKLSSSKYNELYNDFNASTDTPKADQIKSLALQCIEMLK